MSQRGILSSRRLLRGGRVLVNRLHVDKKHSNVPQKANRQLTNNARESCADIAIAGKFAIAATGMPQDCEDKLKASNSWLK